MKIYTVIGFDRKRNNMWHLAIKAASPEEAEQAAVKRVKDDEKYTGTSLEGNVVKAWYVIEGEPKIINIAE